MQEWKVYRRNLSIVAAMNEERVIGCKGEVPWNAPRDMKRFKDLTLNHAVIMGRKTFQSLEKPLVFRKNIILTRSDAYRKHIDKMPELHACGEFSEALELAYKSERSGECQGVFVIGGEDVYKQAMALATHIFLTIIANPIPIEIKRKFGESLRYFPDIDLDEWSVVSRESFGERGDFINLVRSMSKVSI